MNRMPQNQENPKILPILIQTKKGKDTTLPLYPLKNYFKQVALGANLTVRIAFKPS